MAAEVLRRDWSYESHGISGGIWEIAGGNCAGGRCDCVAIFSRGGIARGTEERWNGGDAGGPRGGGDGSGASGGKWIGPGGFGRRDGRERGGPAAESAAAND